MLGLKMKEKYYQICNNHVLKAETRKQIEDKTHIGYSYVKYRRGKIGLGFGNLHVACHRGKTGQTTDLF